MKFKKLDIVKDKITGVYYIVVTGKIYTYKNGYKQIYLAKVNENKHIKLSPNKLRHISNPGDNLFMGKDGFIFNYFIEKMIPFAYKTNSNEKPKPIKKDQILSILA
jgi:hypothetical protein